MVAYKRFTFSNGLVLLVHEDPYTPMAAISLQYNVGSKDESPDQTGLAHLFEHLMFSGTKDVPNFDIPVQNAGGDNNAFTNSDITNFYMSLPANNVEIALWLEADRMVNLNINQQMLDVQKKVVIEEFKETCLNVPYGEVWHKISALAYKQHPYRWPTIGLIPEHIANVEVETIKDFYEKHYRPSNAILTVTGNVKSAEIYELVDKYFGQIPDSDFEKPTIAPEPQQNACRVDDYESYAALDAIYLAFPMPKRLHPDFFTLDLLTDILSESNSSRFYRRILKEQQLATAIDAYVTGTNEEGLVVIEAKVRENVSIETLEQAIWHEIELLKTTLVPEKELEKVKNKLESSLIFSELSIVNKAINLAFYEGIGDVELINNEGERYAGITPQDVQNCAIKYLAVDHCNKVICRSVGDEEE